MTRSIRTPGNYLLAPLSAALLATSLSPSILLFYAGLIALTLGLPP